MESERDPVDEFKTVAERYVALIEDDAAASSKRVISGLAELLPKLYVAAVRLPDISPVSEDIPDSLVTTHQQQEVYRRLTQLVGDEQRQDYEFILGGKKGDSRGSWLVEDLSEIWRDLKKGFLLLAAGEAESEVVWEWRFGFWTHWGEHLVGALHAMHVLYGDGTHQRMEYRGV